MIKCCFKKVFNLSTKKKCLLAIKEKLKLIKIAKKKNKGYSLSIHYN